VHWPIVIGFLKRLDLLFTKVPRNSYDKNKAAQFEKPDSFEIKNCRPQIWEK